VTQPGSAAGPRRPAGRYGPDRPAPRRAVFVAAAVTAVVVAVGWFGYVAFGLRNTGVSFVDIGYTVPDDAHVEVRFQLRKDSSATAVCTVRALNLGAAEVGLTDVRIGPSDGDLTTVRAVVATTERAVRGNVKACVLE
jgi:hypothetical protein